MFSTIAVCALSLLVLILPVIWIIVTQRSNRNLKLTCYVLIWVFLLRLWVGIFAPVRLGNDFSGGFSGGFSLWETICDSLIHTLQTFSLDEDYTLYTSAGKALFEQAGMHAGAVAYGLIISILNICAPILGGAMLLEILAGIFPGLKVWMAAFNHKFVFSELNDQSITLAEDLVRDQNYRSIPGLSNLKRPPVLIFTDAYPDQTSEPRMELFERAKAISAICVKTDLLHLPFRASKSVSYFLIDRKTQDNVTTFTHLLDRSDHDRWLWPVSEDAETPASRIYIFLKTDHETELVWRACKPLGKDIFKTVLVRPIRDYMNTAINLMADVPLFVPLLPDSGQADDPGEQAAKTGFGDGRENTPRRVRDSLPEPGDTGLSAAPDKDLHVTILGAGLFAEEVFRAAFWCGQFYGTQLHIDVLARDAERMKSRLHDSCAELFDSCKEENSPADVNGAPALREAGSGDRGSKMRQRPMTLAVDPYDPEVPENPPYCVVNFRNVDDASSLSDWPEEILDRTDYYVICLGEDDINLETTERIRMHLERRSLEETEDGGYRGHKVIAPIIYDDDLASLIEQDNPAEGEPYVMPFAQLSSRYSCRNILMDKFGKSAEEDADLYSAQKQEDRQKDEYTYWANLVKSVHYPYKLFALGIVESFNPGLTDQERLIIRSPYEVSKEEDEILAWSEHRRWNAFMRAQGFCCPTGRQFERYYRRNCEKAKPPEKPSFKEMSLKLHPCLVERGMERKTLPEDLLTRRPAPAGYDRLDWVSAAHKTNYKIYDYKEDDTDLMKYLK